MAGGWGWGAEQITIQRLLNHTEAASNRDGRQSHDIYGPVIWGGKQLRERVCLCGLCAVAGHTNDANGSSWPLFELILEQPNAPVTCSASPRNSNRSCSVRGVGGEGT